MILELLQDRPKARFIRRRYRLKRIEISFNRFLSILTRYHVPSVHYEEANSKGVENRGASVPASVKVVGDRAWAD